MWIASVDIDWVGSCGMPPISQGGSQSNGQLEAVDAEQAYYRTTTNNRAIDHEANAWTKLVR